MDNIPSRESIITLLSEHCRAKVAEEPKRYVFTLDDSRPDCKDLFLSKDDLDKLIVDLKSLNVNNETTGGPDNSLVWVHQHKRWNHVLLFAK